MNILLSCKICLNLGLINHKHSYNNISLASPKQNVRARRHTKVDVGLDLVCNIGPERSSHYAVPALLVIPVKLFSNKISHSSVYITTCHS